MKNKDKKCEIYYEDNKKQNVYIEVSDLTDCCFELWDIDGAIKSKAKIKIPVKVWKKMLERWKSSNVKEGTEYEYL
tara:strand:+ start:33 stop:260 length:228 start_codon:yes stop_codon:yes gene_type:complete